MAQNINAIDDTRPANYIDSNSNSTGAIAGDTKDGDEKESFGCSLCAKVCFVRVRVFV